MTNTFCISLTELDRECIAASFISALYVIKANREMDNYEKRSAIKSIAALSEKLEVDDLIARELCITRVAVGI